MKRSLLLVAAFCLFIQPLSAYAFVLPITDFGYQETIRLSGTQAATTVSIPTDPGLTPTLLTFNVVSSPLIDTGSLELSRDGATFATLKLPHDGPVSYELPGNIRQQGVSQFDVKTNLVTTQERECNQEPIAWVELQNVELTFEGEPQAPTTLEEFWPVDLKTLHISMQDNTNPELLKAASLITQYAQSKHTQGHDLLVEFYDSMQEPKPYSVNERYVQIKELSGQETVALELQGADETPVLVFNSAATNITQVVEEFFLSTATAGVLEQIEIENKLKSDTTTFTLDELGKSPLALVGAGVFSQNINISQSDFGGVVNEYTLQLNGQTSTIPEGGIANLEILVDGQLIASQPLQSDSNISLQASIPSDLNNRNNDITVQVHYTPPGGNCDTNQHTLRVDIDNLTTTITGNKSPFNDQYGFQRFPQAFGANEFTVLVDTSNQTAVNTALQLIASLQRTSNRILNPVFVNEPAPRRLPRTNALVISPSAATASSLQELFNNQTAGKNTTALNNAQTPQSATLTALQNEKFDYLVLEASNYEFGRQLSLEIAQNTDGWFASNGNVAVYNNSSTLEYFDIQTPPQEPGNRLVATIILAALALIVTASITAAAWKHKHPSTNKS